MPEGGRVQLFVNPTNDTAVVPDVAGMTVDEARRALEAAGFRVVDAVTEQSDDVRRGPGHPHRPGRRRGGRRAGPTITVCRRRRRRAGDHRGGRRRSRSSSGRARRAPAKRSADAGLEVEVVYIDRPAGDQYDDEVMDQNPRVPARLRGGRHGDDQRRAGGRSAAADQPASRPTRHRPTRHRPTRRRPTRRRPTRRRRSPPPTTARRPRRRRRRQRRRRPRPDHEQTLWGKQTELAIGNFPIADRPLDVRVAHALATIKRHAAVVNLRLGVAGLDAEMVDGDRRRGPAHRGRRARRLVPGRRLPDRVGHVDEHERQRGDRHAGVAGSSAGRCTPTTTSTPRSRRTTSCRRRSASP